MSLKKLRNSCCGCFWAKESSDLEIRRNILGWDCDLPNEISQIIEKYIKYFGDYSIKDAAATFFASKCKCFTNRYRIDGAEIKPDELLKISKEEKEFQEPK